MALALQCDRCGSYYDWYDRDADGHHGNSVRISIRRLDGSDLVPTYKTQDLCPECMAALQSFMRSYVIKEDGNE